MNGFPLVVGFPMHWGDMDALGHVNNVRYFRWLETARIAYFARVGIPAERLGRLGPILASTQCDFLRPVVYPADLVVGVRVTRVGATSIHMAYALARAETPNDPVARASSVVVMMDYAAGVKVSVPREIREAIEGLEASSAQPS